MANMLIGLLKRVLIVYVLIFLVFYFGMDRDRAIKKSVNHIRPANFSYLINLSNAAVDFDNKEFRPFYSYYGRMVRLLPEISSAHGMFGLCLYYNGEEQKAKRAYKEAININSYYFWFYYNLGVIHFNLGEYKEAIEVLETALKKDLGGSINYLTTTPVFKPIMLEYFQSNSMQSMLPKLIALRYSQSYQMIVISNLHLKKYTQVIQLANEATNAKLGNQDFFYYYAGRASYEMKQYAQAELFLTNVLKVNPQHFDALYYLMECYEAQGKRDRAGKWKPLYETLRLQHDKSTLQSEPAFHVVIF